MLIRIRKLTVETIIGTYERERTSPQPVVIDVEMDFDGRAAATSDDLADTVDYAGLRDRIVAEVRTSRFHLLERLAARVLELVLATDGVRKATVEVAKPNALEGVESVSVVCSGGEGNQ